jgi:hypothetical protein
MAHSHRAGRGACSGLVAGEAGSTPEGLMGGKRTRRQGKSLTPQEAALALPPSESWEG